MSNDPVDGGTVTYHRARYNAGEERPWQVWFIDDDECWQKFTAEQGEAMGLTPPEPAPLVVACNGHRIELSDEEADALVDTYGDRDTVTGKLARLLRDARQDPQPASEPEPAPLDDCTSCGSSDPDCRRAMDATGRGCCAACYMRDTHPPSVVHQPAPLSPGECLRGLLEGRTDADELIEYAKQWGARGLTPDGRWRAVIGDAAREVYR